MESQSRKGETTMRKSLLSALGLLAMIVFMIDADGAES